MPGQSDGNAALRQASALLGSGEIGGSLVQSSGQIEAAKALLDPEGNLHSWFVPVTIGDRLAGFFQLLPDLTMMRYSSFQRHDNSIDGCPAKALWLDEAAILNRFQEYAGAGEFVSQPYLTYDKSPSRLVWAALCRASDGTTRTLQTTGSTIEELSRKEDQSFGGA